LDPITKITEQDKPAHMNSPTNKLQSSIKEEENSPPTIFVANKEDKTPTTDHP
jgi:hypothetical protein